MTTTSKTSGRAKTASAKKARGSTASAGARTTTKTKPKAKAKTAASKAATRTSARKAAPKARPAKAAGKAAAALKTKSADKATARGLNGKLFERIVPIPPIATYSELPFKLVSTGESEAPSPSSMSKPAAKKAPRTH